ncbi:hypothetical protein CHS0354_023702 [Potamilus streckersoni]|uniref:DAC domain-containing protein n=1 Tax=Potamilus streckersoni TaxID=2493646 RepID=A0AAE0RYZ9_9BIVA|nr:hypothetical protein CHS0354_023702 [Potamilus streckersoni]
MLIFLGTSPYVRKIFYSRIDNVFEQVITALKELQATRTGALIVLSKGGLKSYIETGVFIDSVVTSELLLSIFFKNSSLHDGAVIIENNRIEAARCTLPLTASHSTLNTLGTRHRAAIGITEISDAISIVISEETGKLAMSENEAISVQQDYSEQSPLDILFQVPSNISVADFKIVEAKTVIILQRHPKSDWVDNTLLLLGKALYFQKSYLSADKRFKEIIINHANGDVYDDALEWYARSLVAQGLTVEAAYALQTLIQYPNAKNERKALGYFLLAELSIFPFTSYGSSSSVSTNKELNVGLSHLEYEKAIGYIESGILLKYDDEVKARAYFVLGRIYDKLNLNHAAREAYEKCSQIATNDLLRFSGKMGAAKNFYHEKKYDKALAEYQAILNSGKYESLSGKIRSEIAKIYLANGNSNKAIQTYIEIVQRNPKTEAAMNSFYQLGLYKEKVFQDYKGAQAFYDSALVSFSSGENFERLKLASKRVESFLQDFDSFQILSKMILINLKTSITSYTPIFSSDVEIAASQRRRFQYRASETEKFISNGGKDAFVDFVSQTFNNKPASLILYALAILAYPKSPLSKIFSDRILFYLHYASQDILNPASPPPKRLPQYPLSFSGFNVDSTNTSFLKNLDSAFTTERFKQNIFAVLRKTPSPDTLLQFIKHKPLYKIILESKEITAMLNFNESELNRFFLQTEFLQKDISSLIKEAILTCSKNEGRF